MISIQRAEERGKADYHWLHTRYSFSFADYYNPERISFGSLRVLNDDAIEPGMGFGMHRHDNMEIVTIVLKGALEHQDSMKNKGLIKAGEIQRMSAGSGILHSEYNTSSTEKLKLLQIWVETAVVNIKPEYEQAKYALVRNKFVEVVGTAKEALRIHQDCKFYLGKFEKGKDMEMKIPEGKGLFLLVIEGSLKLGDVVLQRRDSVDVSGVSKVKMEFLEESFVLGIIIPL